ncbi:MAG: SDR family oxidoreductase [Anaerolineae bacterium]|jgi:NAD(P)-dependent dehydrogenase (short-subunit alcohol dehydrogenase family)
MANQGKLQGKLALVTGSGTGLGREVALAFAREGAHVAVHYANSAGGALSAVAEIEALGRRSIAFQADLGQVQACFELVDRAAAFLGGLDILVNNAGISATEGFLQATPERFDRLYDVNIRGQFFCAQQAVRHMLDQGHGGCIVNVTSSHAVSSLPGFSVYAGTKGAIWSWTQQLAVELAPLGIRVNGLCPGWVVVDSHYRETPGFDPVAIGEHVPAQRLGTPADVANACVFLVSDDSEYLVGHNLIVDGGLLAKLALPDHSREKSDS